MRPAAAAAGLVLAAALVHAAAAVAPGARAADAPPPPAVKLRKNQLWVAPDWGARGIRSIAIAPLRSFDRNPETEAITRRGLEVALAGKPFRFRGPGMVHDAIRSAGVEAAWTAASAAAMKAAPLDTATTRALRQALSSDALLFVTVTHWERSIVDDQTRGASFTQVGIDVTLYGLADGTAVWRGSFLEKGDGPFNDPTRSDASERDPSGYSGRRVALDPPTYPEVVEKLMTRLAGSLPKPAVADTTTSARARG